MSTVVARKRRPLLVWLLVLGHRRAGLVTSIPLTQGKKRWEGRGKNKWNVMRWPQCYQLKRVVEGECVCVFKFSSTTTVVTLFALRISSPIVLSEILRDTEEGDRRRKRYNFSLAVAHCHKKRTFQFLAVVVFFFLKNNNKHGYCYYYYYFLVCRGLTREPVAARKCPHPSTDVASLALVEYVEV